MNRKPQNSGAKLITALAIASAAMMAVALWIHGNSKTRNEASARASAWEEADKPFRRTDYQQAIAKYDQVLEKIASSGNGADPAKAFETDLVQAMQALCERARGVDSSLAGGGQGTAVALGTLESERSRFDDLQTRWAKETGRTDTAMEGSGLAFSPERRWLELLNGLEARVSQHLSAASSAGTPPESLDADAQVMRFLERQGRSTADLTSRWRNARDLADFGQREKSAREYSARAGTSLDRTDILQALGAWDGLSRDHPSRFNATPRDKFVEQIQAKLLTAFRQGASAPQQSSPLTAVSGPPSLHWNDHSAFTSQHLSSANPDAKVQGLVFVRTDDLCLALQAATGRPQWVCRVGFDTPGLPQPLTDSPDLIALGWNDGDADAFGVSQRDDLDFRWARRLPKGARLAGPPLVVRDSLCVLSSTGTLWQFDSISGSERGRVDFQEPPAAPLGVRSDGNGLVVAGRQLGLYLLECGNQLSLRTLRLKSPAEDVISTHCLWMAPYVLLIENLRSDNCRLRAYRDDPKGLIEVQERQLPGRLWQPPSLHGAQLLCLTDQGSEVVLGLHSDAANAPLYEIMARLSTLPRETVLQQFWTASHADAPFLTAAGGTVRRIEIQQAATDGAARRVHWEYELADPESVPIQPLQSTSRGVACAFGHERGAGTGVVSLNVKTGRPEWSIELRGVASEWRIPPDAASLDYVLARTTGNRWFRLSRSDAEWTCRSLPGLSGDGMSDWLPAGYAVLSAEGDPLKLRRVSLEGTEQFSVPLRAPLASPLAGREGGIECLRSDGSEPKAVAGAWVAWLDTALRLHVALAERKGNSFVRYLQLPRELPAEGWLRPIWIGPSRLVLVHPAGHFVGAVLKADADLMFVEMTRNVNRGEPFVGNPLTRGGSIWLATASGKCLVFDSGTFEVMATATLPARPATSLVTVHWKSLEGVAVGLVDGRVALIPADDPGNLTMLPAPAARIARLAADTVSERLIVTDGKRRIFELNAGGDVLRKMELPSPESAPPLIRNGAVHVPLVNGGLLELWPAMPQAAELERLPRTVHPEVEP